MLVLICHIRRFGSCAKKTSFFVKSNKPEKNQPSLLNSQKNTEKNDRNEPFLLKSEKNDEKNEQNEPALIKLKNERDPEKLFKIFQQNAENRVLIENKFAFEDTISRLVGAGKKNYIEMILEQQKRLPQGKREGFVIRIIMLYGKAGMIKHALDTFYNMHGNRSVKSFNAALKVLCGTKDLESIERFLDEVPRKFGLELDVVSINIVMKKFCEMGRCEKAYLVMVEMEKYGVFGDVCSYTTLISAFYRNNRPEIGNGLWNVMVRKGIYPNLATFNARIQFLVNVGRAWQANSLMGMMRFLRIKPDLVTYNLVIKGFFRAGFVDMVKRVFSALDEKPNMRVYQTMIHYLCKSGDFDLAYTFCKNSLQNNWFPSVDTISMLLEGLKKNNEYGKARYILSLTVNKVPPLPAAQLHALQSILHNES